MVYYYMYNKARMVNHPGCINVLGDVIKEAGYQKPYLVFDQGVKGCGIIDRVEKILDDAGLKYEEFGEVEPEAPADVIDKGAELIRKNGCDCVVAIGGGSTIDTGKGIILLKYNPGKLLDYEDFNSKKVNAPGLIVIPTTAGTGSEMSPGIITADHKTERKVPLMAAQAMSDYILLDAELTIGMPPGLTLMTGLDVFSHAWESYCTPLACPLTMLQSQIAMETVAKNLPIVMKDPKNLEARSMMLAAASIGGWMLGNASTNAGHTIAHIIGAHFHIPHGAACAYGAPAVMEEIAPAIPEKIKTIGEILGAKFTGNETPEQIGKITADAYRAFRDGLGLKPITDYMTKEQALTVAKEVSEDMFAPLTVPNGVDIPRAERMLSLMFQ